MSPISNLHITKDLPLSQLNPTLQKLFRMVDVIGTFLFKKKEISQAPSTSWFKRHNINNIKHEICSR